VNTRSYMRVRACVRTHARMHALYIHIHSCTLTRCYFFIY